MWNLIQMVLTDETIFNHYAFHYNLGGRVALQFLHDTLFKQPSIRDDTPNNVVYPPKQTWILDSVPGTAHSGVTKVINAVASLKMPIASKKELVIALLNMDIDQAIASWMTTNLKETHGGYEFSFDLTIAQEILQNFSRHDLFQVLVESLSMAQHQGCEIYLVQAEKNESWTPPILNRMDEIQKLYCKNFQRILLPNAGHWVHVDDLNGLMTAIQSRFHQSSTERYKAM